MASVAAAAAEPLADGEGADAFVGVLALCVVARLAGTIGDVEAEVEAEEGVEEDDDELEVVVEDVVAGFVVPPAGEEDGADGVVYGAAVGGADGHEGRGGEDKDDFGGEGAVAEGFRAAEARVEGGEEEDGDGEEGDEG